MKKNTKWIIMGIIFIILGISSYSIYIIIKTQLGPNPNISPPESFSFEVLRLETETGRVYIVNGGINNSQKLINNITIFHNSEKVCEKKKINEYILIEEIKNFEFTNCKLINNDPYSIIIIYDNNKTMTDVNIAR